LTGRDRKSEEDLVHSASKQDFIACLYDALFERRVVSMSEVEERYREISKSNYVTAALTMNRNH
jgi:hypothetical protein